MSFEETIKDLLREVLREELPLLVPDDRLLTTEQVAETLGYTDIHSVYQLKKEGRLKPVYLGPKTLRFKNSDVQKLIRDLAA